MNIRTIIELIGYLGSTLVVVSMLMTSVVKLRVINTIGSLIFTGYALIIRSYPTAAMNTCLVAINVYQLFRLFKEEKHYALIETSMADGYVDYLLEHCGDDIRAWFPNFSAQNLKADVVCLVCHDSNPAGLFIGQRDNTGGIEVALDYTTPVYRDATVGHYLYDQLKKKGVKALMFKGDAPKHVGYMEKVGFKKNDKGEYVLALN